MLCKIKDNYGARSKYKRLGRGIGSGKGKTSARGGKGQTARSGVALNGFEGGQNPLYRRLPKRGFNNHTQIKFEVVNFNNIQELIDNQKIPNSLITIQNLKDAGIIKGKRSLIKLLGEGKLNNKVTIEVNSISSKARNALNESGSQVKLIEYKRPDSEKVALKKANGKKAKRLAIAIQKREARQKAI